MARSGCQRGGEIDLSIGAGCAGFDEEALHPGGAENHDALARLLADVGARVDQSTRNVDGLPRGWIQRMKNSISSLAWRFSAHRMVMDYAKSCYVPAAGGLSCDMHVR